MDHFTHISWGGGSGNSPTITYLNIVDTSTVGASDGEITVTATGPGEPFEYSIGSGYQTGNTFTSLSATTYTISVRNISGFTATLGGIQVSDPSGSGSNAPIITGVTITDASSRVNADGTITIFAQGGLEPYQYKLNDGTYGSNNKFTGLPANTYTLYVKDANGEETSLSGIRINQPPIVTGSIGRKVDRERYLRVTRVDVRDIKLTEPDEPIKDIKVKVII
jgi:hypothetical protein